MALSRVSRTFENPVTSCQILCETAGEGRDTTKWQQAQMAVALVATDIMQKLPLVANLLSLESCHHVWMR